MLYFMFVSQEEFEKIFVCEKSKEVGISWKEHKTELKL